MAQAQVELVINGRSYRGVATLTPVQIYSPGQLVSLVGNTFRGVGEVVHENDDGSVSVRIVDEGTRQRKRVRVFSHEVGEMLRATTPAVSSDFQVGQHVFLNGHTFCGDAVVERVDGVDVLVRMSDSGKLIRVFGDDLTNGRLMA